MIVKRVVGLGLLLLLAAVAPAAAQKVEAGISFGTTISDGVDGDGVRAQDGNIYNEVDVADSASWGFNVGVMATENFEIGFLFNQQMSRLDVKGTQTLELGDMNVNSYHGYFGYNFGAAEAKVRPYAMVGFGATNYGSVSFNARGTTLETDSATQFSTTWGAGVKFYPAPKFGVRVGMQWTPTYIKSDAEGWWCDPWYGCYVVGDAQYSNQLQFLGGVTVRF